MQPPSDRDNKNPFATPSAWPRAPQQTFHLRVPKAPPGMAQAAKPAPAPKPAQPPRPARPASGILTGSALPVGYTAPQHVPDIDQPFEPVTEFVAAEPLPEVTPAPPFIAPPEIPFAAPLRESKHKPNRMPLIVGGALTALAGIAAAWLLMREPEPSVVYEPATPMTQAPAAREPVITPPSFLGFAPEAAEPDDLRGPTDTVVADAPSAARSSGSAAELPSAPVPYAGSAIATAPFTPPPVVVQPRPAPPPPASAPGPTPPVADPDAPQSTRDPTSGT